MKTLFYLIKKNLKLLLRAKTSALIVIFAPLMIILLIGLAYNTSQTGLNIGVHAPSFTEEVNSFLTSLQEEGYQTTTYENPDICIQDIKQNLIHACLSLPEDFQIQDNSPKEIIFYIDQTKINLVYLIKDTLNKKFDLKSQEISQDLTSQILTKLSNTQAKLGEKTPQLEDTKTKSQQAIDQSKTLSSELSTLDLVPPTNIYNTTITSTFKSNASSQIDLALSSLSTAKSTVSSSDLNGSEKSVINSELNSLDTNLNDLQNLIGGSGSGTFGEVSSLISSIKSDLDLTASKLTAASDKVSSAGTQLGSLSTTLNEGVNSLEDIKTSLAEIQQDLANQKITDASTISSPLITKIEPITTENTYLNYTFPSLMVLVVMFISLLLGTTLVMMEKHNQAYFRNFVVPIKKITFVLSTYLTTSFLLIIQIAVILGLSLFFLKESLPQLPLTALVLFVSASVFTLIGMALGYLFNSEDTGTLASISLGALFLFVSGLILPLESMPRTIRQITQFNPFVISEKLVREVFLFQSGFSALLNDFLILIGYALFLFLAILIIDSLASKHFLTRILYRHHKHVREKKKRIKSAVS